MGTQLNILLGVTSHPSVTEPEPLLADGELLQACPGPPSDPGPALSLPSEPGTAQEEGARLRAVFDALDRDGDGFVRIEDFIQFATVYGAEQVTN